MVDFNNDATVAVPAIDVKRILTLQDRHYFKEAFGAYKKEVYKGLEVDTAVLRARLYELFLEIRSGIKRHINNSEIFDKLSKQVLSEDIKDIEAAFFTIDDWLDEIGLTKLDTRQKLGGNIAERNKAQGWKA